MAGVKSYDIFPLDCGREWTSPYLFECRQGGGQWDCKQSGLRRELFAGLISKRLVCRKSDAWNISKRKLADRGRRRSWFEMNGYGSGGCLEINPEFAAFTRLGLHTDFSSHAFDGFPYDSETDAGPFVFSRRIQGLKHRKNPVLRFAGNPDAVVVEPQTDYAIPGARFGARVLALLCIGVQILLSFL
jgi:hypothetical protein